MSRNIRLTISYDGTDFSGWQIQKNGRTVQGVIESALERMHSHPVRIAAAGRTDTGVHADGQVINFLTDLDSIPTSTWHVALNSYLPPDVRALGGGEMPESWSARFDAKVRIYRYQMTASQVVHPMYRKYCWRLKRTPDLARLNRIASMLVGRHDFTTFAVPGDTSPSRVKDIYTATFFPDPPFIVFKIAGRSFLWHMVRSLVGTMIELEAAGGDAGDMKRIVDACDRNFAGTTAPAWGLFLHGVLYDGDHCGRPY